MRIDLHMGTLSKGASSYITGPQTHHTDSWAIKSTCIVYKDIQNTLFSQEQGSDKSAF